LINILFYQFKYAKINSQPNGNVSKGVIFSTYSALIGESSGGGKYKSRLKQLLNWCGDDFDGLVSFITNTILFYHGISFFFVSIYTLLIRRIFTVIKRKNFTDIKVCLSLKLNGKSYLNSHKFSNL
jgi:hypothetical protein